MIWFWWKLWSDPSIMAWRGCAWAQTGWTESCARALRPCHVLCPIMRQIATLHYLRDLAFLTLWNLIFVQIEYRPALRWAFCLTFDWWYREFYENTHDFSSLVLVYGWNYRWLKSQHYSVYFLRNSNNCFIANISITYLKTITGFQSIKMTNINKLRFSIVI